MGGGVRNVGFTSPKPLSLLSAHLDEATAVYTVYDRKGIKPALQLAKAILDNRSVAYRYGLHAVSGPVGKGKT